MGFLKTYKYKSFTLVSAWPGLCRAVYAIVGKNKRLMIKRGTEIVIEGFPRSANTFAVAAFEFAQGCGHDDRPHIAHHLHLPFQVSVAAKYGIPCVVLVRNPLDAIVSLFVRHPDVSIYEYCRNYSVFYRVAVRYADSIIGVQFEDVIDDYGAVMNRINKKFNKSYLLFNHDESNVEQVFRHVEYYDIKNEGRLSEDTVARPSKDRTNKEALRENLLQDKKFVALLEEANTAYKAFLKSVC